MNDEADGALKKWLEFEEDWLSIAVKQGSKVTSRSLCVRRQDGTACWDLLQLYEHVDVLAWFRDHGSHVFPSIAALARVHLGKVSSSAFQERVFSSGSIVLTPKRSMLENRRAEMLLLLKHNSDEIRLLVSEYQCSINTH